MLSKSNWKETKQNFEAWWFRENKKPIMRIIAEKDNSSKASFPVKEPETPQEFHLDGKRLVNELRNFAHSHQYLAEAFPSLDINIGPGSMAAYLGSKPIFKWDTVWYEECMEDLNTYGPLKFDEKNKWLKEHLYQIATAVKESNNDFYVNIPDIIENIDILAAMRGPQELCFDLIDDFESVDKYIKQIDDLYFKYYDAFYDIVKDETGGSSYTSFAIWGPGKTAKVQCDFSALMSPSHFSRLVKPSLEKQCQQLDYSLYHLDGPDAIKHLDAIMEIKALDALQWTAGAGHPDNGSTKWYPIYDKVHEANKSLWVYLEGDIKTCVEKADKIVKRYGPKGLYFLFPVMTHSEALELIDKSEKEWTI